jgi:hypothetical protein
MGLEIIYGKEEKGNALKHTVYINGILNFLLMRSEEGLRTNLLPWISLAKFDVCKERSS